MTNLDYIQSLNAQNGALLETIQLMQLELNKKDALIQSKTNIIQELRDKRDMYRSNALFWKDKVDFLQTDIRSIYRKVYNV